MGTPRLLLATLALLAACGSSDESYLDVRGALADGTRIDGRYYGFVDATGSPWKLQASASGPEDFRGLWLWYDPTVAVSMPYASYGADPNTGPVHFFVLRATTPTSNDASLVDGGQILFSSNGPDNYAGSVGNLALVRSGQTIATIDSGTFLALRPK